MPEIALRIDGQEVRAAEGSTVLDAARSAGIRIPTLCHLEKLEPYGACRLCTVEIGSRGGTRLVAACLYPVEPGLEVRTASEAVRRIRKMILEFLLAHAPHATALQDLAREYGADAGRFGQEPSFCVLCGLCVRYCAEVKRNDAVGFVDCGARREIRFVPEVAARECRACRECFPLCPTSYLQAAFVLAESLAFPENPPPAPSTKP